MKKERQIGVRVGLPAFFALEVEDVYRHTSGAHRALAFPDFLGLLIGLGLAEYRRIHSVKPEGPGTLEIRERKARKAHNPRTLAPVEVPARRAVLFKPCRKLKNALKGGPPMEKITV
jgi:hypothetical protein